MTGTWSLPKMAIHIWVVITIALGFLCVASILHDGDTTFAGGFLFLGMLYAMPLAIGLAFLYTFWRLLWAIIHRLER